MTAARRQPRVRAPELPGAGADWLGGTPITLASQRGRFVLLDFWTSCCANCLHVLDELRPLEAQYADILTVIGVHSAKFAHERDPRTVHAAAERYEVRHPVVNDPDLRLWQQYAVKAWPTLALIDPEGYLVAQAAGEGQVSALAATIDQLASEHEGAGTLRRGAAPLPPPEAEPTTLRFPAKAIVLPAARTGRERDSLLVADAGHHRLVELDVDGETVVARLGSGIRGSTNGPAEAARFAEPNGLALLPAGLSGYDVLVADTANHLLRGIRLAAGDNPAEVVATVDLAAALAGTRTVTGPIPPVLSPWDVIWWPAIEKVVVAAAGVHLLLAFDPRTGSAEVLAGTTVEGLRDGRASDGWLAQPSGLAVSSDGDTLWFVDAETSALRCLHAGEVQTAIGEGLFDFGHVDGPAAQARLQHPLGVTALPDGSVAVLDTYNGAVRRYDPATGQVSTLARDLAEPSGAVLVGGDLVVVESAAHRLVRLPALSSAALSAAALNAAALAATQPHGEQVSGAALRTARPPTALAAGPVRLQVVFQPPPGRKLDERYGPSTQLSISASPPALLPDGAGESVELRRDLVLAAGDGVLHVTAQAASCDDTSTTEHPACYLARQDWGVPVQARADGGATELRLVLLG